MAETLYNHEFQERHLAGSLLSAAAVLPILFQFHKPKSIVDIGCGFGAWLKIAGDLGIGDLVGLDGEHIDRAKLLIDPSSFRAAELSERIALDRRFDLAISVEVAEHLPYSRSESFVADLTALSDVVLFSAAAPYQGGTNHINEQWLEFWGILFRRFGYIACDVLRPRVWGNSIVEFWYRQNLVIFCKAETAAAIFPTEVLAAGRALSFTHPLSMLINAARYRPFMQEARELECLDYAALTQAYVLGETTLPPLRTLEAVAADQTRLFPKARILVRDAAADIGACHVEIARLGTDVERRSKELEDRRRDIDALHEELEARRRDIDALYEELGERSAEIARLNGEIARLNGEIARLRGETERLNSELVRSTGEMQREIGHLNGEISRLNDEIARLNAERQRLDSEMQCELGRLNGCIARERDRVNRMGIALAARNREVLSNRQSAIWRIVTRLDSLRAVFSANARTRRDVGLVMASGLFDRNYYLTQHPSLERLGVDPVRHYVEYGAAEGRDPNPLFHTSFYLETNPDVARSRMNPLAHYHAYGGAEARDPHPSFKTSAYLAQNPEVLQAGMTPLLHYLVFGNAE